MGDETLLEKIKSSEYKEYFQLFGNTKGIELLSEKSVTVNKMINDGQVKLMYYWYQKTGYKFIPDYVVMQNFPLEEIDSFLENGKYWSRLMKINEYSLIYEGRVALLKLAYCYGIFNDDKNSINHLEFLLKGIPLKISRINYELLLDIENRLINACKYNFVLPTKEETNLYLELKKVLKEENLISKESEYIFKELYKSNNDDIYNLQINWQLYPNIISSLRNFMELWGLEVILTPFKAYQIFKDFDMKYEKDFKNFLIDNIELILSNYEYSIYFSEIQKQFKEIKKVNSNRVLTYNMALDYVKDNNYINVEVGNEKLADLVSKTGVYNQYNFEMLQKIYNYSKMRVYNSIPRINGVYQKYSYEMLKLDDPLASVIGIFTDCCQKLNDSAELCMEHSMVSDNGRLFVVRDNLGQIVAQSWVWRNNNVICFDDIEIPNKVLVNAERKYGEEHRYQLAKEIYDVYKYASLQLLEIDNITYKNLFDKNIITKEEYVGLKLNKVIVGLGHNDIANIIKKYSKHSGIIPIRPLYFNPPVRLRFSLYLNDSSSQYLLAENNENIEYIGYPINIYNDEYTIYTDKNMSKLELLTLENLRKVTDNVTDNLITKEEFIPDKIVSLIARKYNSEENNTKLIINPNFAIIYVESEDKNIILDLFLNSVIESEQIDITNIVLGQIKLAIKQINRNNKKVDVSKLPVNKLDIYTKIKDKYNENNIEIEKLKIKIKKLERCL